MPALSDAGSATEWGRKDGEPGSIFALIPVPVMVHSGGAGAGKEEYGMGEMQFPLALESERERIISDAIEAITLLPTDSIAALVPVLQRYALPSLKPLENLEASRESARLKLVVANPT